MCEGARIMVRGRDDGILRGDGKALEEGRTPGVGKRFGATKAFLIGSVR